MRIPLDRQSAVPLYRQIESYLRQSILSGSLAPDTRACPPSGGLPGTWASTTSQWRTPMLNWRPTA